MLRPWLSFVSACIAAAVDDVTGFVQLARDIEADVVQEGSGTETRTDARALLFNRALSQATLSKAEVGSTHLDSRVRENVMKSFAKSADSRTVDDIIAGQEDDPNFQDVLRQLSAQMRGDQRVIRPSTVASLLQTDLDSKAFAEAEKQGKNTLGEEDRNAIAMQAEAFKIDVVQRSLLARAVQLKKFIDANSELLKPSMTELQSTSILDANELTTTINGAADVVKHLIVDPFMYGKPNSSKASLLQRSSVSPLSNPAFKKLAQAASNRHVTSMNKGMGALTSKELAQLTRTSAKMNALNGIGKTEPDAKKKASCQEHYWRINADFGYRTEVPCNVGTGVSILYSFKQYSSSKHMDPLFSALWPYNFRNSIKVIVTKKESDGNWIDIGWQMDMNSEGQSDRQAITVALTKNDPVSAGTCLEASTSGFYANAEWGPGTLDNECVTNSGEWSDPVPNGRLWTATEVFPMSVEYGTHWNQKALMSLVGGGMIEFPYEEDVTYKQFAWHVKQPYWPASSALSARFQFFMRDPNEENEENLMYFTRGHTLYDFSENIVRPIPHHMLGHSDWGEYMLNGDPPLASDEELQTQRQKPDTVRSDPFWPHAFKFTTGTWHPENDVYFDNRNPEEKTQNSKTVRDYMYSEDDTSWKRDQRSKNNELKHQRDWGEKGHHSLALEHVKLSRKSSWDRLK